MRTHVLNRGWGAVWSPADSVLRHLGRPILTQGAFALTPAATWVHERLRWQEDSGHVRQFIGPR